MIEFHGLGRMGAGSVQLHEERFYYGQKEETPHCLQNIICSLFAWEQFKYWNTKVVWYWSTLTYTFLHPILSWLSRRFLGMTKIPLLPIRKLPEVSSILQVSWCFMALGGIWKDFQVVFGANMFAGMSYQILGKKSGVRWNNIWINNHQNNVHLMWGWIPMTWNHLDGYGPSMFLEHCLWHHDLSSFRRC